MGTFPLLPVVFAWLTWRLCLAAMRWGRPAILRCDGAPANRSFLLYVTRHIENVFRTSRPSQPHSCWPPQEPQELTLLACSPVLVANVVQTSRRGRFGLRCRCKKCQRPQNTNVLRGKAGPPPGQPAFKILRQRTSVVSKPRVSALTPSS